MGRFEKTLRVIKANGDISEVGSGAFAYLVDEDLVLFKENIAIVANWIETHKPATLYFSGTNLAGLMSSLGKSLLLNTELKHLTLTDSNIGSVRDFLIVIALVRASTSLHGLYLSGNSLTLSQVSQVADALSAHKKSPLRIITLNGAELGLLKADGAPPSIVSKLETIIERRYPDRFARAKFGFAEDELAYVTYEKPVRPGASKGAILSRRKAKDDFNIRMPYPPSFMEGVAMKVRHTLRFHDPELEPQRRSSFKR